jgi:hypothetical protein
MVLNIFLGNIKNAFFFAVIVIILKTMKVETFYARRADLSNTTTWGFIIGDVFA